MSKECYYCNERLPDIFCAEKTGKPLGEEKRFCNSICQKSFYLSKGIGIAPQQPKTMMIHHSSGRKWSG